MRTLSIQLPDPVFDEAAREAAASGRSVEQFVAEIVRDGLYRMHEDAPLTPEQIEKVRQAQAEIAQGDSLTAEEVEAHFARKLTAWTGRP
jgi:hypothetical protein